MNSNRAPSLILVLSLLLISLGVNGLSHLVPPPRRDLVAHVQHLAQRNLSAFLDEIPTQCGLRCEVVQGSARACPYLDCVCTVDNSNALVKCVNCVVALTPYADGVVDKYQSILDEWKNSHCSQFYTPPMKVSILASASPPSATTPTRNNSSPSAIPISAAFWAMTLLSTIGLPLLFLL